MCVLWPCVTGFSQPAVLFLTYIISFPLCARYGTYGSDLVAPFIRMCDIDGSAIRATVPLGVIAAIDACVVHESVEGIKLLKGRAIL
jgi:hypothetical protein